jgi:hypothetical protein
MKSRVKESWASIGLGDKKSDEPKIQYTDEKTEAAKDLSVWTSSNANRLSVISYTEDNNENLELDFCSATLGTVTIDDYKMIKLIGKGGFGKVFLAEHKDTKEYHAVKCMRKDQILEYDKVESII